MKKSLLNLLVTALSFAILCGCGKTENKTAGGDAASSEAKAVNPVKIGVAVCSYNDTWIMYMKDYMQNYAATYGNKLSVTFVDGKDDVATQLGQVENLIMQGMDAIIVIPVNTQAVQPITDDCLKAKVKLVYLNRLPSNLPDEVHYVGSDSIKAGEIQMDYLVTKMGTKGSIAIMMGKLDNESAISRTEGVKKVAAKYPDIKIVRVQTANYEREKGMTLMENWISSGDKIDAVVCNNDDMALGAIKALQAAGKLANVYVCGVDATPDALVELEKGNLSATVFQNGKAQGEGAIKTAYDLVVGKDIPKEVWIPFELVTKENIKNYKK